MRGWLAPSKVHTEAKLGRMHTGEKAASKMDIGRNQLLGCSNPLRFPLYSISTHIGLTKYAMIPGVGVHIYSLRKSFLPGA